MSEKSAPSHVKYANLVQDLFCLQPKNKKKLKIITNFFVFLIANDKEAGLIANFFRNCLNLANVRIYLTSLTV